MSVCFGIRYPVATASFIVVATLFLAAVPTKSIRGAGSVIHDEMRACGGVDCGDIIMLEDFANPRHKWKEMNDPVMGGKSTGSFAIDSEQKLGIFHGNCEIVSFLNAPGFIKAETSKGESWPDVSTCKGLQLTVKSTTPSYKGFRVSFGHKRPPGSFPYIYGFKTNMYLEDTIDGFQTIQLPFESFTDKWDAGSGDAVVTCEENKDFCPDEATKKNLYSIGVWGEGVEGEVDLQIQSIAAYGCGDANDGTAATKEDYIAIEDFTNPVHSWRTMNDPVMGGKSKSSLDIYDGMASFEGTCAIVPFLRAPGFITMTTGVHTSSGQSETSLFPDVSNCEALQITLRSRVHDYEGYYVSFGTDRVPGGHHAFGYKTHFSLQENDGFVDLVLPFSDFSSHWDEATGKTTIACRDDPSVCPSVETLRNMKTISFWGEGVEGKVALDIQSIGAVGCASANDSLLLGDATVSLTHSNDSTASGQASPFVIVLGGVAVVLGVMLARHRSHRNNNPDPSEYLEVEQVSAEFS